MPDWHMHQAAQLVSSQGKATMLPLSTDFPPAGPDLAPVLVFLLCLESAYLCQMDAKQLKCLRLYTLERKRLKSDFTALQSFLRRESGEEFAHLFSLGSSDRTCGNSSKLHQGRFRLDIRKHFPTECVLRH